MKSILPFTKKYSLILFSFFLCLVFLPITIPVLTISSICFWIGKYSNKQKLKDYGLYTAIAYDRFANVAVFLGSPQETISSRLGRAMASGNPLWWIPAFVWLVDHIAYLGFGDKNHTSKSIEVEGIPEREIVSWQQS